jgi:hypothetical protein
MQRILRRSIASAWMFRGREMAERKGWNRKFEDPIVPPDGRELVTLRDAANYITALPAKESAVEEWQVAIEALMLCSRSGPTMMARIGVMKALNRTRISALVQNSRRQFRLRCG